MKAKKEPLEAPKAEAPRPTKGMKCEATYDFSGVSKEVGFRSGHVSYGQDLPFKKGDVLTIENPTEDPNWWLVRDKTGKVGMIPANYVVVFAVAIGLMLRRSCLDKMLRDQARCRAMPVAIFW